MKHFLVALAIFAMCVMITFACSLNMSPDFEQNQAGGDIAPPQDNVHEQIDESCGTANEKSGCHLEF